MFQFAPRKMIETDPIYPLSQEECRDEGVVYNNDDIQSPNPSTSTPQSPLVMVPSGEDDLDSPLSPPVLRTYSYDATLFDLRKVPAEKIAAQLTLIDLDLFKAIRMKELVNANWTKKDKSTLAPNVVAFTARFNHTSFWVVREILNESVLKARADIVTQFIKIAKKLLELNNIHSLKAVLGGLQSGPIYRLSQTWKHVARKDKGTFERLEELLSSDENWKALRAHMDEAKLPCIPHLGLYLTDLCFLCTVPSKEHQEDSIRNMIAYFQNSTYDGLVPEVHVQKYLLHKRYIDELQKFHEEENYKLSQLREPDPIQYRKQRSVSSAHTTAVSPSPLRISKSHEDLLSPFAKTPSTGGLDSPSDSPVVVTVDEVRAGTESKKKTSTLPKSFRAAPPSLLEMRKAPSGRVNSTQSEGGTAHLLSPVDLPEGRGVITVSPRFKRKASARGRGHKKAQSLGSNVLQMLGVGKHPNPSPTNSQEPSPRSSPSHSRSLIDDTLLDHSFLGRASPSGSIGNGSSSESSDDSGDEEEALYKTLDDVDEVEVDYLQARLVMEGPLKRKIIRKGGRIGSFGNKWSKVWAQLTDSALIFLASKPKGRKMGKPFRTKGIVLRGWRVKHKDDKKDDKQFVLFADSGTQLQFKAASLLVAQTWVERITLVISGEEQREKRKAAEECLITL